jgi:hypothetical protein
MYQWNAFGENTLWNLRKSDNPVTPTDFTLNSVDASTLNLSLDKYGITIVIKGSYTFPATSPTVAQVNGTAMNSTLSMGDVLLEREIWGNGADLQSLFNFDYTLGLLEGDDYFEGSDAAAGNDNIQGLGGNDRFRGNGDDGGDYFFGGDGIDTSIYRGKLSEYLVSADSAIWDGRLDDGTRVSGYSVEDQTADRDGKDYLNEVERLQFSDKSLALDVGATQNAGKAKLFTGAIAHSLVNDAATLGTILHFIDNGYSDLTSLSKLAIDVGLISKLAGSSSNEALAGLVTTNLLGQANAVVEGMLLGYMNGTVASFSQAQFLGAVAALEVNQQRVDLVGLAETGMEYVPLGL